MSIERDLSHKIEIELESNLYPFLINNIKMLLNNKENIVHNFGNVTFKTGHVRLNIDDSVQEEYDTIQKEINELRRLKGNNIKTFFKIMELEKKIHIPENSYLSITEENNNGYIFYQENNEFFIYKTFKEFTPSDKIIENLSFSDYIKLIEEKGRLTRELSDENFDKYPKRPSLNYIIDNILLKNENSLTLSSQPLLRFSSKMEIEDYTLNSKPLENFKTKFLIDLGELNNAVNLFTHITTDLNNSKIDNNYVLNSYNQSLITYRESLSDNIKLKFNQVFNIAKENLPSEGDDFSDLDKHVSIINLSNMPNYRSVLMETQNRDLLAIEDSNGDINIYQVAREINADYEMFYYNDFCNKNSINEKVLLNRSSGVDSVASSVDDQIQSHPSLKFFKENFDNTQQITPVYSSSNDFVFNNILNENMAYITLTNCQLFLCYSQDIDFDKHTNYDSFSLEHLVNKNMSLYSLTHPTKEKALLNTLMDAYSDRYYKGYLIDENGTDVPFDFGLSKSTSEDLSISWYSFTNTDLAVSIPLDIKDDFLFGIKQCLDIIKDHYSLKPELIEDYDVFNKTISNIEKNILLVEQNKNKNKSKKSLKF